MKNTKNIVLGGILGLTMGVMATATAAEDGKDQMTVVVTGANRGLGLEFAKKFEAEGYEVIGTARKPEEATKLKEAGAEVMKLDVTDNESIDAFVEKLDGKKVDILINNAGIFPRNKDRDDMMMTYQVNTLGPYFVSEALVPNLKKSESPRIVNVSSGLGQLTDGGGSARGYSFSKAALNMVTRNLHSAHSGDGLIVISLNPGHNKTDMGGDGAPLDPKDTAAQVFTLTEELKPEQSGLFWMYTGKKLDW